MPNETNVVSLPETCNIRLYRYYGEPNKLNKGSLLTNFKGDKVGQAEGDYIAGTMKTPLDFITPTFFIESDKGFPWNYLRFQDTTSYQEDQINYGVKYRFYFITSVVCLNAGVDDTKIRLYQVECLEDVLYTFRQVIFDYGYGFVDRNEFERNPYIIDSKRVVELGETVTDTTIPSNIFNFDETEQADVGVVVVSGVNIGQTPKT